MKTTFILALSLLLSEPSFAGSGSATVILLRGTVSLEDGKPLQLKDEVSPGSAVKTGPRSFAKLLFKDNSQVNVGPETTLKLEPTQAGAPSLVNLVGGQIRAKVTKDLLQGNDGKSPEKLLIKTKTAAMGIRGTDFNVSFNQANNSTALVTFEGNVAMVKVNGNESAANALAAGNNLQSVGPGQFSGVQPDQPQASIPVKISPGQLETLRRNDAYQGLEKTSAKAEALASPVPPGVDAKLFASGGDKALKDSVGKAVGQGVMDSAREAAPARIEKSGPPPEGFYDAKSGAYAPRAGGFLDLNTGRYVPPPPGSSFDPNTGVFVPPRAMGQFDPQTGMYVPPAGVQLDAVKGFVAETKTGAAPAPANNALTNLLNFAVRPELAGQQASFEKLFTPTAGGGAFAPPPNFQAPPLPGQAPPPVASNLPPPPKEPVSDATCPYCVQDNIVVPPTITSLNFVITVQ
jgi:hypothetical protein